MGISVEGFGNSRSDRSDLEFPEATTTSTWILDSSVDEVMVDVGAIHHMMVPP